MTEHAANPTRHIQLYPTTCTNYCPSPTLKTPWAVSRGVLDQEDIEAWFVDGAKAAARTASDGQIRTVQSGANRLTVGPRGTRPGLVHDGPPLDTDLGERLQRRLLSKSKQTAGGPPAWIRLDVDPTLFALTGLSAMPPRERLQLLSTTIDTWLAAAPHVVGVLLSSGTGAGSHPDETIALPAAPSPLLLPAHVAHRRQQQRGSLLLLRQLPGYRVRTSYVLPARRRATAADDLDIASWYDNEADWLSWALSELAWPQAF